MLQLKNITKVYYTKFSETTALKGINLTFREGEFVAVLGPSGCGKTTLLNIIGGLDRYTDGDLIINGKSTKNFTDSDWDSYRNHSVGFVFQNYNLIPHISIIDNVQLGMTLSGVNVAERYEKALNVLKRVGLESQINKLPSQLSGGQKQRVAIARALVNNPDVILADEPTGALDSKTSVEVMELIKEISREKLVIMVTHNQELANHYATRIVRLLDGEMVSDSRPVQYEKVAENYKPDSTAMNFITALKLSFNNLKTKKVRTFITALAGSIGIIGISLVISISNGFSKTISNLEESTFSGFPLQINKYQMLERGARFDLNQTTTSNTLIPYDPSTANRHENIFSGEFITYINKMDPSLTSSVEFDYGINEYLLTKTDQGVQTINQSSRSVNWNTLYSSDQFTTSQYDILAGNLPKTNDEIVVVVDSKNQINQDILTVLGLPADKQIQYNELLGKHIVLAQTNDIYIKDTTTKNYSVTTDLLTPYNNGMVLTVSGVLRGKSGSLQANNRGLYYKNSLTEELLKESKSADVCIDQGKADDILVTGMNVTGMTKEDVMQKIGCSSTPSSILIYPKNNVAKEAIKNYINAYNDNKPSNEEIFYSDISDMITSTLGTIVRMVSSVLVAFAAISLVVSSIMIGIITYVSVLERTKEIGILRSLGARKKDISRVFNAETIIIGFVAGALGIVITFLLSFPVNAIVVRIQGELKNIVQMTLVQSVMLIVISMILTLISGLIPSRIAAKKDPVEALRHNE